MHKTHPNQIRSACERCRRQKLRCSRQTTTQSISPEEACARCTRLGTSCQPGSQRKLGRPSRREYASATTSAGLETLSRKDEGATIVSPPTTVSATTGTASTSSANTPADFTANSLDDDILFDDGNAVDEFQWMSSIADPSFGLLDLDLFNPSSQENQLTIQHDQTPAVFPFTQNRTPLYSFPVSASTTQFASLSKINVDLHASWQFLGGMEPNQHTLQTLTQGFCIPETAEGEEEEDCARQVCLPLKMSGLLAILSSLQEYLVAIKALHRKFGVRSPSQPGLTKSQEHAQYTNQQLLQQTLDTPTALLVVSCFTQLVKCLEVVYGVANACLALDGAVVAENSFAGVHLAGVHITEFSTQAILFTEVVRHVLRQIYVVLGLPTNFRGRDTRPIWTGLLTGERYRDLLNQELGNSSEPVGGWTTRPTKLLEDLDHCKEIILERSLSGYD